jgi:hypothetical protein
MIDPSIDIELAQRVRGPATARIRPKAVALAIESVAPFIDAGAILALMAAEWLHADLLALCCS